MPHDRNGTEINVGDRVYVEAEVVSITMDANYCNTTLRTVCPMPPYEAGTTIVLNTKQTMKVTNPPGSNNVACRVHTFVNDVCKDCGIMEGQ